MVVAIVVHAGQRACESERAMLILLVHTCCHAQGGIPASLEDLRRHLAQYGLKTPVGELIDGGVGTDLEKLGLVVDRPNAAGGRMLVAPF
jgi:hypothetical protein